MSTIYKSTVLAILQRVSDFRGESTTNTDAQRIRFLTLHEQDVAMRRNWRIFLRRLATVSGDGGADYTIGDATYPMRLHGLTEVFVGGTTEDKRYEVIDYHQFIVQYNRNNAARIAYEYYDAANDAFKIHINPSVDTGTTIYYSYYWCPPTRTSSSDAIVCPDMEILVNLTVADVAENADEKEEADSYRNKAEILYSDAAGREDSPAQNQLHVMGSIDNAIRPRGYGTY